MQKIVFALFIFFLSQIEVFAGALPFTDVKESDPYYTSIATLYDARVISDDGSHLFRPALPMTRDFYVSLTVGIGCKKCDVPSIDDIIRYKNTPFVDLNISNPHYYCIAYAAENKIAQGYITDQTGKASCENNTTYTSPPFCAGNTISRIEAAAILLRRAVLWNDTMNTNTSHTIKITDTSNYWYGYARKAIELGIIQLRNDSSIGQDEKITRGEFAMMAARVLRYIQCDTGLGASAIASAIDIRDVAGVSIQKNRFSKNDTFNLVAVVPSGNWQYRWTAKNINSGVPISGSDATFPGSSLSVGDWAIVLQVIDPNTGATVSTSSITLSRVDSSGIFPCVSIRTDTLSQDTTKDFVFTPTVCDTGHRLIYSWDYGDGLQSSQSGVTHHAYDSPGVYTTTLTITDTVTGQVGQTSVVVAVTGDKDTDKDGIPDNIDQCPLVQGPKPTGCPAVPVYDPDSDGDGIPDSRDQCPKVKGVGPNGCPTDTGTDTDGDSILDEKDRCPTIPGLAPSGCPKDTDTDGDGVSDIDDQCPLVQGPKPTGCPAVDTSWTLDQNSCLSARLKSQGLLIGHANCTQCPCDKKITITSPLRPCDIVFPTILSPNRDIVYSRGGLFTVE